MHNPSFWCSPDCASRKGGRATAQVRSPRSGRLRSFGLAGLLLSVVLASCASGGGSGPAGPGRAPAGVFGEPSGGGSGGSVAGDEGSHRWGVLLERFAGPQHEARARSRSRQLASVFPGWDLRVERDRDRTVLLLGSFAGLEDPSAQRALEEVKSLEVGGRRPYRGSFLVRPRIDPRGSNPSLSLVEAAARSGGRAAYTLQVELWDAEDVGERMAAAEARAAELRARGEEAYFHHGPRFSVVTVELFGTGDWDETVGRGSPRLRAAQERFPYMLLNGQRYRFRGASSDVATLLIRVPD